MISLNLPHGESFLPYGEKNLSPCGNLSRASTGLGAKRRTLYFLTIKMKSKFLKFKILQRIIRKFPAIQWNRPNVILFHETIPLKTTFYPRKYVRQLLTLSLIFILAYDKMVAVSQIIFAKNLKKYNFLWWFTIN
jgi:hypothetical protein